MKSIFVKADALLIILVMSCAMSSHAHAQVTVTCPPAPNQLTVTVAPQVKFDPTAQLFTYTYTVANGTNSAQEIDSFNLDFTPPVSNLSNPPGWAHGIFRLRSTLGWSATVPASPPLEQPTIAEFLPVWPRSNPLNPWPDFRSRVRSRLAR